MKKLKVLFIVMVLCSCTKYEYQQRRVIINGTHYTPIGQWEKYDSLIVDTVYQVALRKKGK